MTSLADYYQQALQASPALANYPDMATVAAQSPDPTQTAQVLTQSGDAAAMTEAVKQHKEHHGLFHSLISDVEGAAGDVWHGATTALGYLGKPLADIQHDYRYLHDLWVKSDPVSATLATLGVIGGATAGAMYGGGAGLALGADAVAAGEAHAAGAGLFNSINPRYQQIYRESAGEKISPGRDLANLLGLHDTDSGLGKIISGSGDLAFDFTFDPVARGLGLAAKARTSSLGLTDTYAARRLPQLQRFLVDHGYGGLGIQDHAGIDALDRLNAARNNPQYERAIDMIASSVRKGGAGAVVSDFPSLYRMSGLLADADTADKVHDVFLAQANAASGGHGYNMLPSRTITRRLTAPVVQKLKAGADTTLAQEGGFVKALNPKSDVTLGGAVTGKVRTFSGYLPYTIDRSTENGRELLNLSGRNFDVMDPGSLQGMYRSLRFSMSEKAAQAYIHDIAVAQLHNDERQVRTMWLGAHKQMLVAAGIPDDHNLVRQVSDAIASNHVNSRAYAYGHTLGQDANYIDLPVPARPTDAIDAADTTVVRAPAAVWSYQATTQSAFPDFWKVKNAVRELSVTGRSLGGADEFFSNYYINKVFKPLALVNMGFGLRVAAAEAIPAAFRYGALNMLQNRIAASSALHDYKVEGKTQRLLDRANTARESGDLDTFTKITQQVDAGELGHLTAAVTHILGGAQKALRVSDEKLALATRIVHDGQGHIVWGVGRAGEATHLEPLNAVDKQSNRLWFAGNTKAGALRTGNHTYFTPDSSQYSDLWMTHLNALSREEPARRITQDILAHMKTGATEDEAAGRAVIREANRIRGLSSDGTFQNISPAYEAEREKLIRYQAQTPDEFAAARVDSVRNLITGQDGTFHEQLAKNLAAGKEIPLEHLDSIDPASAPRMLHGQEIVPLPPKSLYSELINKGFKTLVDPVINKLSREPLFLAAVEEQIPSLRRLVEKGVISEDDMYREAYYRATEAMLPQIHNVQLRSQFAALSRNLLPFYFAQEQAIKRTAFLATKDPGALRQYQQLSHALSDPNFIHADDNGNRSLVIPLAGGIGKDVLSGLSSIGAPVQAGLPLTFTGSTSSLKTVLPELVTPGVSPLVSVPLNELAKFFPEWTPAVKSVVGDVGLGQPAWTAAIPNQLMKNGLIAYLGPESDKQFANAMTSSLAAAAYHGELPPADATPQQKQAFLDRIKNNARSIMMMKGILATFSPLSPRAVPEDFGLRDEFYTLLGKKGATYQTALQEFIKRHGTKAVSYTIAKSENPSGAYIPDSQNALDFISGNRDLISNHISAAYFVPQTTTAKGDSQSIFDEEVNMGLRARETPDEFLTQMYVKSGTNEYIASKKAHEQALAGLTNQDDINAENAAWSQYLQGLNVKNPIWADDFSSNSRDVRAHLIYNDMLHLFGAGAAPAGGEADGIAELVNDYQRHVAALAMIPKGSHDRTLEKDAWQGYLQQMSTANPQLASVIDNVFNRLDRSL